MKRYLLLPLVLFTFVSPAHAWFGKSKKTKEVTIAECAHSLTKSTGAPLSLTNRACQHGQTNADFQSCTLNLLRNRIRDYARVAEAGFFCAKGYSASSFMQDCTIQLQNYFGRDAQYIPYSASLCSQAREDDFAFCVGELFTKAGVKANVAANLCLNGKDEALNSCMVAKFKELGNSERAYSFCSNPTNKARYSGNAAVKVYPLNEEPPVMKSESATKGDSGSGGGSAVIFDSSGSRQEIIQPSTSFSSADMQTDLDGGVLVDLPMPK